MVARALIDFERSRGGNVGGTQFTKRHFVARLRGRTVPISAMALLFVGYEAVPRKDDRDMIADDRLIF
jgi:hypothetical protein